MMSKSMIEKIVSRARKNILKLQSYKSARLGISDEQADTYVLMNANENPYFPIKNPLADNDIACDINRYSQPQPDELKDIFARTYDCNKNQIMITRGSDEAIDILIRAFCEAGQDKIITLVPTFGMYKIYASIQGIETVEIPLLLETDRAEIDVASVKTYQDDGKIKIVFLPNPSAPIGNAFKVDDIKQICDIFADKALVVVDEAYIEFSESASFISQLSAYTNLVILRTLSKAYGMAGVRMGVCISHSQIIDVLNPVRPPYPLSSPSINLVKLVFDNENMSYVQENIAKIKKERVRLADEISGLPWVLKVYQSDANFIFIQTDYVQDLVKLCYDHKIMIRAFASDLKSKNSEGKNESSFTGIRLSVGTCEQNNLLIALLKAFKL